MFELTILVLVIAIFTVVIWTHGFLIGKALGEKRGG